MYDCIIIGAGPAGAATAYHLAQRGRRVLVLEKASLPRYKPCSGAVSPSIARYFSDCDFTPAIERQMRRVRYTWKLEDAVEGELETADPIWMVNRAVFDQLLVEQAQHQGAEIQDATAATGIQRSDHWQVCTEGRSFSAQYLVAADGASGPTASWLGLAPQTARQAAALEISTPEPVADDCAISFEFGLIKNGCLWSFPKRQGYSLGVCAFRGKNLQDFRTPLAAYARHFGISGEQGQLYTHPLKIWDGNTPLHGPQALVVGEAAALVDPLSAEGIRPAIASGVQAADAIHRALQGHSAALEAYTRSLHETWGADMVWAQRIASMFYRVPGVGYRLGIKRPTATQRLGQLLTGEVRYADIANRVIKRFSTGLIPGLGRST